MSVHVADDVASVTPHAWEAPAKTRMAKPKCNVVCGERVLAAIVAWLQQTWRTSITTLIWQNGLGKSLRFISRSVHRRLYDVDMVQYWASYVVFALNPQRRVVFECVSSMFDAFVVTKEPTYQHVCEMYRAYCKRQKTYGGMSVRDWFVVWKFYPLLCQAHATDILVRRAILDARFCMRRLCAIADGSYVPDRMSNRYAKICSVFGRFFHALEKQFVESKPRNARRRVSTCKPHCELRVPDQYGTLHDLHDQREMFAGANVDDDMEFYKVGISGEADALGRADALVSSLTEWHAASAAVHVYARTHFASFYADLIAHWYKE